MRLIFCGTPQFAVPTLEALVRAGHEMALVVTQPDRPRGRGMELAASPVKQAALARGLAVAQPERIKSNAEFRAALEGIAPEAIVVVGYGRIVPPWMLALPPHGNINLHASLLPKYRGAAPIQWAIACGESVTGVTTMRLNEGLDTGDMLLQREEPIRPEDTAVTLAPRLAAVGAELTVETLRRLEAGTCPATPQDDARATLAPILTRDDGAMRFARTAVETWNRLRGFQPWPGAFALFRGRKLIVHGARPLATTTADAPGTLRVDDGRLLLACGGGSLLEIVELQIEGKRRMDAREFAVGYQPRPGERLEEAA